ncbi:MAG: peptidylprolyl isomerase [Ardenticatenaceae bacterium]
MAKKQSRSQSDKQPKLSSKRLTRIQKQAEDRQRLVMTASVAGVLIAVILLLGGLHELFVKPAQAMAEVDGQEISRSEFYQRVNYERFRLYENIIETKTQAEEMLSDPQSGRMFLQFFQQQLGQLQNAYAALGSQTLEQMIEERIIEKKATDREVTVSDEEVDEEIRREVALKEGAQIEVDVEATATAGAEATATALLFTPTPTLEPSPTPTDTIESTVPITPTATPAATNTPAPTPTPNILSDSLYDESYGEFLAQLEEHVGYTAEDHSAVVHSRLLRQKMQELIGSEADVSMTGPFVNAAHILVETEEEMDNVVERLNNGEDFAEVAIDVSTDTGSGANGGELGWFGAGQMVPVFEEAAFALTEPGQVSDPVQSQFGWHIIKLLEGPEERDLPENQIEQARNDAFNDYLSNAKEESDITRYWDLDDIPDDPFIEEIVEPLPTLAPVPTTVAPELPSETAPEIESAPEEESAPEAQE